MGTVPADSLFPQIYSATTVQPQGWYHAAKLCVFCVSARDITRYYGGAVKSLRELEARHYRLESLNAELADIEKKISKEVQLDRKYALAKEKQRIGRELGRVVL